MNPRPFRTILSAAALLLLASCGGSTQNEPNAAAVTADAPQLLATMSATRSANGITPQQASRFLAQATFGPDMQAIDEVRALGYDGWLERQFGKPQGLLRPHIDRLAHTVMAGQRLYETQFYEAFWQRAAQSGDQLRQRVTFALSEIFVVSFQGGNTNNQPRGLAGYYDTLGAHAFGNFRDLLEAVATHPMMGLYLSHLHNQKEDGERLPDENFARELMQLFTIGLYELNQDGSLKLANGHPIETYDHGDVAGLAKVFTGWSWGGPDRSRQRFFGDSIDPDRAILPMQNYPDYHSTSSKSFLGMTIGGGGSGEADMKLALDHLFNHPNVGPFIGRQLIQRLVTSNPSPAYITRVAAAFNNDGHGVRGDMRAVVRAILLDPEARGQAPANYPAEKVREPVVRIANWMRAFHARSRSGRFMMGNTDDPVQGLGQSPLSAPSVFNFYRPGYTPPNSAIAAANKVAPEMQIVGEPEVVGYINYLQDVIVNGAGGYGRDIIPNYVVEEYYATDPDRLLDRLDLLLMNGNMTPALRAIIKRAVEAIPLHAPGRNPPSAAQQKSNRVYMAILLCMAAPEYIVQK